MKKILLLTLLFSSFFLYSQKNEDLLQKKKHLQKKTDSLEKVLFKLKSQITHIDNLIEVNKIKKKSFETSIKSNTNLYTLASEKSNIIEKVDRNSKIYILEYYQYGNYYKAIFNNKIGYVPERKIRITKGIKNLKLRVTSKKKKKETRNRVSRYYVRGPRGGCYYINSNGNKTYVSRSLCN